MRAAGRAYVRETRLVLLTAIVVGVPAAAVAVAGDRLARVGVDSGTGVAELAGDVGLALVALALGAFGGVVLAGVLDGVMEEVAHRRGRGGREALLAAARRVHVVRLLGADLLVTGLILAGVLLLVVPGLIALVLLALTGPVISMDGVGPWTAVRRSAALVRRAFWPMTLALAVPAVALGMLDAAASAAGPAIVGLVTTTAITVLAAPYLALVRLVAAHDLKGVSTDATPFRNGVRNLNTP